MTVGNRGKLFLVPTPIGNLEDITLRAVRILGEVDLVLCEDTRRSSILFGKYGIKTKRESYHEHNKYRRTPGILERLHDGAGIALITEAGTPGISDPGFYLTRAAIEEDIPVETLPGACAAIVALVNSGLPTDRFTFEGFLPAKKGRKKRLAELQEEVRTIIFYESPHRIKRTLSDLKEALGERRASWGREISKIHEDYQRGTLTELAAILDDKKPKGEFTLIVEGNKDSKK
ncbi:16S rRNA (cytidine(1402)-2'-O)-methyltransferase [candidate division LCP-89 bacterium B3_LCP]|uniref:Ribosomal RNA small subunit methyltransferase I n=1 Tax=candidate division LCP-89 bacterium B3_LCP TaxID=2012998 RepID=A0A532V3C5_UNCL8|nr:MAG: 16S rRNA (cytidine(1402)-2'-O)-methyltransferase [candidate division LCP-89 bacterium B3_LCP]